MRKKSCIVFLLIFILMLDLGIESNAAYNKTDSYENELNGYSDEDEYDNETNLDDDSIEDEEIYESNYSYYDSQSYKNYPEDILNYDIDIYVNKDSSMNVTERITVNVKGRAIKHGIYRDFPTQYKNKSVTFEVNSVLLNGSNVEYTTEKINRGVRLKIGSERRYVPSGIQVYEINYTTQNQLFFEKDYNELYWNLIGTGWLFGIEKCSAQIHFPEGTKILSDDIKSFVGEYGNSDETKDVKYSVDNENSIVYFSLNKKIPASNAFTIVVRIEKGTISKPSLIEIFKWNINNNIICVLLVIGLIGLGIWQFITCKKNKNKIDKRVIIPKYYPPDNLDVTQIRYIDTMGKKNRILESTILSLATKGFVHFTKSTGKRKVMVIEKTHKKTTNEFEDELSDTEKFVYNVLAGREYVIPSTYFHNLITNLKEQILKDLSGRYKNSMFSKRTDQVVKSIVITILIFIVSLILGKIINPSVTYNFDALAVLCLFVFSFGYLGILIRSKVLSLYYIILLLPLALLGGGKLLHFMYIQYSQNFIDLIVIVWAMIQNLVFAKKIRGYSERGVKIKEDIECFKMFIKATNDDFDEKTPEMFDKYFAYAYALGLENKWAKKFEKTLEEANYTPDWCADHTYFNGTFRSSTFTSRFSSAFSAKMAAASVDHSSGSGGSGGSGRSSSRGGGGFSGGGGGGRWPEVAGKKIIKLALSY